MDIRNEIRARLCALTHTRLFWLMAVGVMIFCVIIAPMLLAT